MARRRQQRARDRAAGLLPSMESVTDAGPRFEQPPPECPSTPADGGAKGVEAADSRAMPSAEQRCSLCGAPLDARIRQEHLRRRES